MMTVTIMKIFICLLAHRQMEDQYTNLFDIFFPKPVNETLKQRLNLWFVKQRSWADSMIKSNPTDPFWRHAGYIFAQLDGLLAGYKSTKGRDEVDFKKMFCCGIVTCIDTHKKKKNRCSEIQNVIFQLKSFTGKIINLFKAMPGVVLVIYLIFTYNFKIFRYAAH